MVASQDKEVELFYDVLVGADGVYSLIREKLDINCHHFGEAIAAVASIPLVNKGMGISLHKHQEGVFMSKLLSPSMSLLSLQVDLKEFAIKGFQTIFKEVCLKCGFEAEANAIEKGEASIIENISVTLQQAETFSDEKASAILVGDATATASFLLGMGCNTGFLTAELAGNLFKSILKEDCDTYEEFNRRMKEVTDLLIQNSAFLFLNDALKLNVDTIANQ